MEEEKRGDNILKETLSTYKQRGIKAFIMKKSGRFYSGEILELAGDLIILDDIKLGAIQIYFFEIDYVEAKR